MFRIIFSKKFLLSLLVLSATGAIYAFFIAEDFYDKIDNSEAGYACLNQENSFNTILVLRSKNAKNIEQYFRFINHETEYIRFNGSTLEANQLVFIYQIDTQSNLAEIYIKRDTQNMAQSYVERYWIWTGFLKTNPC